MKNLLLPLISIKEYISLNHKIYPYAMILGIALVLVGWGMGLFFAPIDAVQGHSYRIIYLHVPMAIYSQLIYWFMAIWSFCFLVWKIKIGPYMTISAAYVGCMVTFLALFSGSVWGIPTWGTWWQWDARITSTFILLIMYIALLTINSSFQNINKADQITAWVVLVGVINIPIIKKSVDWWSTLHQPASISLSSESSIDSSMLIPLSISIVGVGLFLFALGLKVSRLMILKREEI
ncbi:MAG: heme ABC transporter permease CcmC [Gammaproteobacteria bacterium]|jgi:heme exporter protein C|tara:strand:+ start:4655 stop:5359 length:705 start_codon:yes stop_codon:yes gene_type:complete